MLTTAIDKSTDDHKMFMRNRYVGQCRKDRA